MAARMPILRQHYVGKSCCQAIDQWHDFVPARDRQVAAGAEVDLDIEPSHGRRTQELGCTQGAFV